MRGCWEHKKAHRLWRTAWWFPKSNSHGLQKSKIPLRTKPVRKRSWRLYLKRPNPGSACVSVCR